MKLKRTLNIEHRTSNIELSAALHRTTSMFDVRCSMFNVRPNSIRRKGFSFAEVMFAVVILGIGFIMVAAIFPVAIQQTQSNGEENIATLAARDAADAIGSLPGMVNNPAYDPTYVLVKNADGTYPPDAYKSVQSYPAFPPTIKNFIQGKSPTGAIYGVVAPPAVVVPFNGMRWQLLQSNSIQINDQRFAYVPFYRRENGSDSAELIVIAVAVRNKPQYASTDVLNGNSPTQSNPTAQSMNITLNPNANMTLTSTQATSLQNFPPAVTTIYPDTINLPSAGTWPIVESNNLAIQMPTGSGLIGRTYTCGRYLQYTTSTPFEINPGDGLALTAGFDGRWGTPNAIIDNKAATSGFLLNKSTLQPQVAYAILRSTPNNPSGEITLYTDATGQTSPPAAVPGAFVIVADDYPFDPAQITASGTANAYSYTLVPNLPSQTAGPGGPPPYAVGALNGRIFRLASATSGTSPTTGNPQVRFNLDPAYGMRPAGTYSESPDVMPGQSIQAAVKADPNRIGQASTYYDSGISDQFRVKVYIVGAATTNGGAALGSAQDIGVFATYFQVK